MILYTSSASFFPVLMLFSITFLPASISCLILAIADSRWELVSISIFLFLIYSFAIFLLFMDTYKKKYFLEVTEKIIVKSPWCQKTIELTRSDVKTLEYLKASSITSWLSLTNGVAPGTIFLNYIEDGVEKSLNIGCAKFNDVKEFCAEADIKLIKS